MQKILICGVNWLGDGIMSMPAVNAFKKAHPNNSISILLKSNMIPLWEMCSSVDDCLLLESGFAGTLRTVEAVAAKGFNTAYVFPNSVRSALIPFMAGIPRRRGMSGHTRSVLLTESIDDRFENKHQLLEYMSILELNTGDDAPVDAGLHLGDTVDLIRKRHLGSFESGVKNIIGMIPGAAYGPSKMWPAAYFVEVGRKLIDEHGCKLLVMGIDSEREICMRVSEELGDSAICLAGETNLRESAILMGDCSAVICNDSGGMHLAAAAGTKVVAVYGVTDPFKTGPLGDGHRLILADGVERSRDIERESMDGERALLSIKPEKIYEAVVEFLQ